MKDLELKNIILRKALTSIVEAENTSIETFLEQNGIKDKYAINNVKNWLADEQLMFSSPTTENLMAIVCDVRKQLLEREIEENKKVRF